MTGKLLDADIKDHLINHSMSASPRTTAGLELGSLF